MITKEHIAAKIFTDLVWHFTGKDNELFLTFDDGPTPEMTPWVLSVLKEFDAKATFFCIGQNVEKYPEIYQQILDEGHSVGNHTYSHKRGWFLRNKKYVENINKAALFIDSGIFRPPFGKIKPSQISKLKHKYQIVMWNVFPKDYDGKISKEKCLQTVLDYAESGSIIVFHDTKKAERNLKYALPQVLKILTDQGFMFNSITFKREE